MKVITILVTLVLSTASAMRRHPARMLTAVEEEQESIEITEGDAEFVSLSEEAARELEKYEVPDEMEPPADEDAEGSGRKLIHGTALIGLIDGPNSPVYHTDYHVKGWACQLGDPTPVTVQLYAFGPPGTHGSVHIKDVRANLLSEGGIATVCRTHGRSYRFEIPVEYEDALKYAGQKMYVVGVSTRGTKNTVLARSGVYDVPHIPSTYVTGFMDGYFPDEVAVKGWACQTGFVAAISVELYVGAPKDAGGVFIRAMPANHPSEEAISAICKTQGRGYRYRFPISELELKLYQGQPIYVYGVSSQGTPDSKLANSGTQSFPRFYPIENFNIRGSASVNKLLNTMDVELQVSAK